MSNCNTITIKVAKSYGLWINGEEKDGVDGKFIEVINPATGELVAKVAEATDADVKIAITAAEAAFDDGRWSKKSARERGRVLRKAAQLCFDNTALFAEVETLCTGRAIKEMKAQTGRIPEWLEYFGSIVEGMEGQVTPFAGDYLNYVRRVPIGVCVQLTAFNHPMLLAMKKLAPALAAGNTVVMKPSELTPISAILIAKYLSEAGLPAGVFNVVNGYGLTCGAPLVGDPRVKKVDMTGGTTTGRLIGATVGRNLAHFTAELGGKAPILVFNDATLEQAVNGIAFGAFVASGQTCVAATRLLVQEDIAEKFAEMFVAKCNKIRLGDPLAASTQMGCMISNASMQRVDAIVQEAVAGGCKVLCGGKPVTIEGKFANGPFYPPTLIGNVKATDRVFQEELFGPVLVMVPFKDEAEALALANNCDFGLGAAVWTRDIKRGHRVAHALKAGVVWINDHHRNDPSSPWGGMKLSGVGRENGWECLKEYTQTQSVVCSIAESNFDWFDQENARYG